MRRNELQKGFASQGKLAVKIMSFYYISGLTIVSQILLFGLSAKVSIFPSSETLMTIITTCAQIIAGLYGVTMAGYTFFLSRIDALTASDATLDFIVSSIKKRFKYLIWFLTLNVLICLFTSIFLMYCPIPEEENSYFFYRLFCNEFIFAVASSILMILYYSVLVIDPNCIEKEAAKLKRKLSSDRSPVGSSAEFIVLYDQLETLCNSLLPQSALSQIHANKGKRFEYTLELLQDLRPDLHPILPDLYRVHRYYECAINCKTLSVSQDMCRLARMLLEALSHNHA